jgi:hypothetical protein
MFEIIKLFVEQALKLLNIKELVTARKGAKLAEIGVELFELYSSLNRILVCGLQIVDDLEEVVRRRKESEEKQNP